MKKFFVALIAATLATGAAQAANIGQNERPGSAASPAQAVQIAEVKADEVLSSRELSHRGIPDDTILTVTSFPTSDAAPVGNSDR